MSLTPIPAPINGFGRRAFIALAGWWAAIRRYPFVRGARISLVTIYALFLRDAITQHGRRSAGYVWALLEPLLQLTVMMAVFTFFGRAPAIGDSMVVFFLTGILPVILVRIAIIRGANAISSNRGLMAYPQVSGFEIVTARLLLEVVTYAIVVALVALTMFAFTGLPLTAWVSEPLKLLAGLSALVLLCYGSGFLSAQIGRVFAQWSDLMSVMGRLLFFTSGVWYTLGTLPPRLREAVSYNPLAQVIEWIRDGAISGFNSAHIDYAYPIVFGSVCLFLGLFVEWLLRLGQFDLPGNSA